MDALVCLVCHRTSAPHFALHMQPLGGVFISYKPKNSGYDSPMLLNFATVE